jgi:hypothetical protein
MDWILKHHLDELQLQSAKQIPMKFGEFKFGLYQSNITPTLHEAQIKLYEFSQKQFLVQ